MGLFRIRRVSLSHPRQHVHLQSGHRSARLSSLRGNPSARMARPPQRGRRNLQLLNLTVASTLRWTLPLSAPAPTETRHPSGRAICAPKDLNAITLQNFTIELLPTSTSRTALPSTANYQSSKQSSPSAHTQSAPPTPSDSSHPPPHSTGPPPSSPASIRSPSPHPKNVPTPTSRSTHPAPPPSPPGPAAISRARLSARETLPAPGYCIRSQTSPPPSQIPSPSQSRLNSAQLPRGTNASPPSPPAFHSSPQSAPPPDRTRCCTPPPASRSLRSTALRPSPRTGSRSSQSPAASAAPEQHSSAAPKSPSR